MIFDYREYITERGCQGIVNFKEYNENNDLFKHNSVCPFCKRKIKNIVFSDHYSGYPDWLEGQYSESENVIQCPNCGWWEYKFQNFSDAILDGIRASDIEYKSAILKQYENDSKELPLELVRQAVKKNSNVLCELNPNKLEDLVRSVLGDFYPGCKVYHFGKTRDGGKDGLLVDENGKQFLIQVKRRQNSNSTESVAPIRELIGVSVLEKNTNGCIFVSTAAKYSQDAISTARLAVEKRVVESFELINRDDFCKYVDLTTDKMPDAWEGLLKVAKTRNAFD